MTEVAAHGASGRSGATFSRRSMLQFMGLGAAALSAAPLLSACGSGSSAAGSPEKFGIASFPGDVYFWDEVALKQGLYEEHNLVVDKHLTPQSGVQGMQLLVAEGIDGFGVDTLVLMSTFANSTKGKRPQLIGTRTVSSTYGIVAAPGLEIPDESASFTEKMQALKGKTIGVSQIGAGSDHQLRLALEEAGMEYGDVTALAVGPSAQMIPNIKEGRIDAAVAVQWTSTRHIAEETGGAVLLDFADASAPAIMREQTSACMAVRENTLENDPEVVENWLAVQKAAAKWMVDNPEDAADLLNQSALGGNSPDIAAEYIQHYTDNIHPVMDADLRAPRDQIERMIKLGEEFGNFPEGSVTYDELVPEFARL